MICPLRMATPEALLAAKNKNSEALEEAAGCIGPPCLWWVTTNPKTRDGTCAIPLAVKYASDVAAMQSKSTIEQDRLSTLSAGMHVKVDAVLTNLMEAVLEDQDDPDELKKTTWVQRFAAKIKAITNDPNAPPPGPPKTPKPRLVR